METNEFDVHIRPSHFILSLPLVDHQNRSIHWHIYKLIL